MTSQPHPAANAADPFLQVESLGHSYPTQQGRLAVLRDVTFSAQRGDVVAIRGSNGCGKTTLLNLIAGLLEPTSGRVRLNGASPPSSTVGFLFQDYASALLPWYTLEDNCALPLQIRGVPRSERLRAVAALIANHGLTDVPMARFPQQCSGGQQQKASFVRALATNEAFLILDEPFSSLDTASKDAVVDAINRIHAQGDSLLIVVAHDLDDLILVADRVLCLGGTPTTIDRTFAIDLPWPRHSAMLLGKQFSKARRAILGSSHAQAPCS